MKLEFFDDAITSTYPMILSEVKGARNNNKNIHLNSKFCMSIFICGVQIVGAEHV